MTNNRIVPLRGRKSDSLAKAEEIISRQGIEDALRAATFAYEQRLQALRADAKNLQDEYLAEVARIIEA